MGQRHAVFTEVDARGKWCPFARTLGTLTKPVSGIETVVSQGSANRGYLMGGGLHNCMCLASGCMAWRWHTTHIRNPEDSKGDLIESVDTYGYCGMAGVP